MKNINIKIEEGTSQSFVPEEPIIGITGNGRYTYLWIGNNKENNMCCYGTLTGKSKLRYLANKILERIEEG